MFISGNQGGIVVPAGTAPAGDRGGWQQTGKQKEEEEQGNGN